MTGSSTSTSSWMLLPMLLALFVISSFSSPTTNHASPLQTNIELSKLKECSSTSNKTQLDISVPQSNSSIQYFTEGIKLLNCTERTISNLSRRLGVLSQDIIRSGCLEQYPSPIKPTEFHEKLETLFHCYHSKM